MPILNYTTEINASKTVNEVQALLVKNGAHSVQIDYENGEPSALEFRIDTRNLGRQSYCYPVNAPGVLATMKADKKVPRSKCTFQQATRVAWRIEKDWLEAQFAKIRIANMPLEQVLLPYMLVSGRTTYEIAVEKHKALLPPTK